MKSSNLNRREFTKLTTAAMGGIVAGLSTGGFGFAADGAATSLLLEGKNVCRGLNHTCGGHKGGSNKCSGTGSCATAAAHGCHGANECKGEGGCGATPGENACKGKGACGVPLGDKAWGRARARFETAMTGANRKFGAAPAKGGAGGSGKK